ncbi:MAG TPA: hypothetical protein PKC09_06480 [Paracoccus sp. (in: a-proteobacteria)]|uniref:hypothetical protein n=1 Tax=uncultured Paracoccus sp. TaxID=189685 RepID=UPI0026341B25|nr:hypothetical protein [uncultured Paracoccus sp.]HMQ40907.1 hypothetical protein [Paracoccus sp. (in: a-proteobacteria)]HMR36175.1 hypothetical protein [Paracoccus sp. (in: a-proteobacteria)]
MIVSEILSILDARSFASPWFWLVLVSLWTLAGRGVLGVPNDVLARAGQALRNADDTDPEGAHLLLDWLSLQLPRWQISPGMGAVLTGAAAFGLTTLALLGFRYQLEMAQALTLLAAPFALLLVLKLRLARQLGWVMEAAHLGQPARVAAIEAMRRINRYRLQHTVISLLAVTLTAFWAARWMAFHPNGM